ncbi:hypothetical protein MPSEU_000800200 [Mayamaea pseudoterrestris]|nr:hypothetical protein MPSEU_000800200 [Mayamaea pseudoterrestris]
MNNPPAAATTNNINSTGDEEVQSIPPMVIKILKTRKADCSILPDAAIIEILKEYKQTDVTNPHVKLHSLLRKVLLDMVDTSRSASDRRQSYMCTYWLLQKIDDAVRSAKQAGMAHVTDDVGAATKVSAASHDPSERMSQASNNLQAMNPQTTESNDFHSLAPSASQETATLPVARQCRTSGELSTAGEHFEKDMDLSNMRKRRWDYPSTIDNAAGAPLNAKEQADYSKHARLDEGTERTYAALADASSTALGRATPAHQEQQKQQEQQQKRLPNLSILSQRKLISTDRASKQSSVSLEAPLREERDGAERTDALSSSERSDSFASKQTMNDGTSNGFKQHSLHNDGCASRNNCGSHTYAPALQRASSMDISARWEPPSKSAAAVTDDSPESTPACDSPMAQDEMHLVGRPVMSNNNELARASTTDRVSGFRQSEYQTSRESVVDNDRNCQNRDHHRNKTIDSLLGHRPSLGVPEDPQPIDTRGEKINRQRDLMAPTASTRNDCAESHTNGTVVMHMAADTASVGPNLMYSCATRNLQRPAVTITFNQKHISDASRDRLLRRLIRWDPYWLFDSQVQVGKTFGFVSKRSESRSLKSAMQLRIRPDRDLLMNDRQSAVMNNRQSAESAWGDSASRPLSAYSPRVLLRMIPVDDAIANRADCHLWPRGTFLQINGKPVQLQQRKMTNQGKWEGNCKILNLGALVKSPFDELTIEMCCHDDMPFYFCLAVCRYQPPIQVLYDLMDRRRERPLRMLRLLRGAGIERAKRHLSASFEAIDAGDDEDVCAEARFTFSLLCPISKRLLTCPVRGVHCKHWQCFNLVTFLESNVAEGRQRWRCAICENFIAVEDLQLCKLTRDMLSEFKDIATTSRDRVEFRLDGTYELLPERRIKSRKKALTDDAIVSNDIMGEKGGNDQSEVVILDEEDVCA